MKNGWTGWTNQAIRKLANTKIAFVGYGKI
jgi:hypothetical protein